MGRVDFLAGVTSGLFNFTQYVYKHNIHKNIIIVNAYA
jgi:hypothetical protein